MLVLTLLSRQKDSGGSRTWDLAVCLITTITFKSYNALKPFKSSRLPPTQQTTTFTTLPCFFSSTYRYCAFKKKKKKEGNNVQKNLMLCTEQSQMEKGMFYLLPQANNLLLGCLLFCSGSFLHCRKASQAAESQAILGTLNFTVCLCSVYCTDPIRVFTKIKIHQGQYPIVHF